MVKQFEFNYYYANFYDSNGVYVGRKRLDPKSSSFNFGKGTYLFYPEKSSYMKVINTDFPMVVTFSRYYFYNVNNPEPLIFIQNYNPLLSAQDFHTVINTDVLKKLNDLSKDNWLMKLLSNPFVVVSIAVVVLVVWWLSSHGGKLW